MPAKNKNALDPRYVDVLDGIRAISIICVLIFHFWQQTWIFPVIQTPFLKFIGVERLDFTVVARVGYLFVDMMILISGFLLFLPVMRHIFIGEEMIDWKQYAKRRIARIAPSYYFAVLVAFFTFALPTHAYATDGKAIKDLVTHLTFTQFLFTDTLLYTPLNAALWTVSIEVWFYILFPLFACMMKRREPEDTSKKSIAPSVIVIVVLYVIFQGITILWQKHIFGTVLKESFSVNQLPAFMGTYANGMVGAAVYVLLCKNAERTNGLKAACTILSLFALLYIVYLMKDCAKMPAGKSTSWQLPNRFMLTSAFMVFILSAAMSANWFRFLFSNRLMRFLAGISYNLYIWHQYLAVQFKDTWRIPYWQGTTPPNQLYDHAWMNKYALIITVASFAAAILATYLIEKPFANLILGKPMFGKKQKPSGSGTAVSSGSGK